MNLKILHLENRINLLNARDPIGSTKLINKLKRQIRQLEKENN